MTIGKHEENPVVKGFKKWRAPSHRVMTAKSAVSALMRLRQQPTTLHVRPWDKPAVLERDYGKCDVTLSTFAGSLVFAAPRIAKRVVLLSRVSVDQSEQSKNGKFVKIVELRL